ncbi:YdeI/OmpD-associated family protein [Streptosporangium roseum]|uniref:YdeI/OmpD-associated family protein n=1 Tax=Streptosporangium roseum TaxID=2001 RepID=UPI0033172174
MTGEPSSMYGGPDSAIRVAAADGMEIITFDDADQWEAWLDGHHELRAGAWLKIAKKNSGRTSVTCPEALDVALCYGWIDSQRRSCDETHFLQKYSRRRPGSLWSKVNVDKVEALVAAGRMRAPGLAEVLSAKADGRWDAAYESQKNATVPPDLADALERNGQAKGSFELLNRTDRYIVILRLAQTRTPDGRAARLQKMVAMLEAGERIR